MILASGGIDSTACINFFKKLKFDVEAIFVDYGQSAAKYEYKSIVAITKFYKIELRRIVVKNNNKFKEGFVPGRNAFLYFMALMNFNKPSGRFWCFYGMIALYIVVKTNFYITAAFFICCRNIVYYICR